MNTNDKYYIDGEERFVIENYNQIKPFSSFLPAVSGLYGKPLWAFYVNRGQCLASFGINNKDFSIMEFQPANKAYRQTSLQGFRTFLKIKDKDGRHTFYEPFQNNYGSLAANRLQKMSISSYDLKLIEINQDLGLKIEVMYCTLPGEFYSALIREVSIENIGNEQLSIELLDGLPVLVPYFIANDDLKNESNLRQAWISVKNYNDIPFYKIDVLPHDTSETSFIEGANFYLNFDCRREEGFNKNQMIIDPDLIFGETTDLTYPDKFYQEVFNLPEEQVDVGKMPCGFGYKKLLLKKGARNTTYSLIGHCGEIDRFTAYINNKISEKYMLGKIDENRRLIESLKSSIFTVSNSREFDLYAGQTFLDNILRGGKPVTLGQGKLVFYVYSRKHGDLEREYNFFQIDATYFSQGNANFRDVNQNRRNDIRFFPFIGENNIETFFDLIQLDGYNPLVLKGSRFEVENKKKLPVVIDRYFHGVDKEEVENYLADSFTPGELTGFIEKYGLSRGEVINFLDDVLALSRKSDNADFKEGYWIDHWTYNIDLLEQYLSIYPDRVGEILFDKKYKYYDSCYRVLPRRERYVLTDRGVRQYRAVEKAAEKEKIIATRKQQPDWVRTENGQGEIYYSSLLAKAICLLTNKMATLDPFGAGVEMETGKPGWCDALNGLPGLLGSSLNISLEIKRLALMLLDILAEDGGKDRKVSLPEELFNFFLAINDLLRQKLDNYSYWEQSNRAKELYREKILYGISGREVHIGLQTVQDFLRAICGKLEDGIAKAFNRKSGIYYTYFINSVDQYRIITGSDNQKITDEQGRPFVEAISFKQRPLPYFLEGPVHWLRVNRDREQAVNLFHAVKKTGLYDQELSMYRVNDNLVHESREIGRQNIFPRGWLENEAVFLHMEYKYLLELLRSGLYEEYFASIKEALIPFQDPAVYGRSILENSSFIVSSVHPDEKLYGKGYISRLTGATAEFLTMWQIMTAGKKPFFIDENGQLSLQLKPVLPSWLFTSRERSLTYYPDAREKAIRIKENSFAFVFLGQTLVIYHNQDRKNTYGKNKAVIKNIKIYQGQDWIEIEGSVIKEPYSQLVRQGMVDRIEVVLS